MEKPGASHEPAPVETVLKVRALAGLKEIGTPKVGGTGQKWLR